MSDLSTGLAKLRRATEFACGYPDVEINRAEAHAILTLLDERREMSKDLIDAMWDAEHALGKALSALEREARKDGADDNLKVSVFDTNKAFEQTVLRLSKYVTTNA